MIKLFPHVLMRISGGPFRELESLNMHKSVDAVKNIIAEKEKKKILKDKLSDELFSFIQQVTDPRQQNLVLNIRRDIFNNRKVSAGKIKEVEEILSDEIKKGLQDYFSAIDTIRQLEAEAEPVFNKEQVAIRENFKKLVQNENLQKGLLLSSKSLLDQMHLYLGRDSASLRKKEQQIEQGLMKYVTRMYAKTSPFSTFTNLATGTLVAGGKTFLSSGTDGQSRVISHIRLNNYIFQYLKTLFFKNKEIFHSFLLRPNPTIRQEQEMYVFLTNHNNVEAFQRMPFNGVLELLVELCSENKDGLVYKELIRTILDNQYIDASEEELDEYIQQLLEYGFFEYNIGVSGIDPDWDLKIVEKLNPLAEELPLIKELIQVLKDVRQIATAFGNAEFAGRKKLIDEAYAKLRSVCMKLHEAAGLPAGERKTREEMQEEWSQKQKEMKPGDEKQEAAPAENDPEDEKKEEDLVFKHQHRTYFYFKPEQLFYEDTTLDIAPQLNGEQLTEFLQPVRDLFDKMRMFEGYTSERIRMADYFEKKYESTAKVDLLTFYEDFYRDVKKVEAEAEEKMKKAKAEKVTVEEGAEKEAKMIEPLPVIPKIKALEEKNKAWQDQFTALMKEKKERAGDHFAFGLGDIYKTHEYSPHPAAENTNVSSHGLFVQFFTEKDEQGKEKLMGVLNSPLPGFGKLMSRFLHIFDDQVTEEIRDWNKAWIGEDIFVEGCDASVFNANLHPTLMPYETWMPGSQNSLPSDRHIPITDIAVCIEGESLKLIHKPSEKRLYTFDLGFQGIMGRSRLFQLMSIFSLVEHLAWNSLTGKINSTFIVRDLPEEKNGSPKKIIFRPRIVFEDRIILQRKMWFVPKELLPLRQSTESDWAYFEKVNEWRIANNLPEEAFIFVGDRGPAENIPEEDRKKLGKDDYKPQYMNFSNPLLVNLFEKSITKVPVSLKIEEMLPGSEQLFRLGKEKHVIEFMVQWYEKNGTDSAG